MKNILLLCFFFISGCNEFRYGPASRFSRAVLPGDDQNCLVEFSPRQSASCNNP